MRALRRASLAARFKPTPGRLQGHTAMQIAQPWVWLKNGSCGADTGGKCAGRCGGAEFIGFDIWSRVDASNQTTATPPQSRMRWSCVMRGKPRHRAVAAII